MAVSDNPFFEFPAELQKLADKNAEQMRAAFGQFAGAAREAVKGAEGRMETALSGAREVRDAALEMAEQNVASSFQFAHSLLAAKDPQEIVRLHAEFARSQITALTGQAQDLARRATRMAEKSNGQGGQGGQSGGKVA